MKKRNIFSIVLVVVLCLTVMLSVMGCDGKDKGKKSPDQNKDLALGTKNNDFKVGGSFIVGTNTAPTGDFRFPGIVTNSPGATDLSVANLTTGYATMELDFNGDYQWNSIVVKNHSEEEIDHGEEGKTLKITIEINDGLVFSDKTPITAKNFLIYPLVVSTAVSDEAYKNNKGGQPFVGYEEFKAYTGPGSQGSKEFKGLRLIDDHKFSVEISSDYYPYYYAATYGVMSPQHIGLVCGGANIDIKDDGNGAYLTDNFYAKTPEGSEDKTTFACTKGMKASLGDVSKYPFSGPYTIEKWDNSSKVVTMKINPEYLGNFEGQKPHIERVLIKEVVAATQTDQLKTGIVDMLTGLTGGADVNAALALDFGVDKFKENHYDRAGYGKLMFQCDFGPTMFTEVRQAVAYSFDRDEFANTFCTGYGAVVDGPYATQFTAFHENKDIIDSLNGYPMSEANAKKALIDGGWTFNSKGEAFEEGKEAPDDVRYKKLSADDAIDVNTGYKSLSNTEGCEYKTVEITNADGSKDYYMPLVINWFSTENNPVSDLLATMLMESPILPKIGMRIHQTTGIWDSLLDILYAEHCVGDYGMLNLASNWSNSMYDNAYTWIPKYEDDYDDYYGWSANKLSDPYDKDFSYNDHKGLSFDEAMKQSGGKLGMNYLSFSMVYTPKELGDPESDAEYYKWWGQFIKRWNELLPEIPLYGNVYYDVYDGRLLNFRSSPFRTPEMSLLYCAMADAQ